MANTSGNAYSLSLLCPIRPGVSDDALVPNQSPQSHAAVLQDHLENLPLHEKSPLAKVPNTYTARLYVLSNVVYQGKPAHCDELKSQYLVFSSDFHGKLEPYLTGMWQGMEQDIRMIWKHCVGFEAVNDAAGFIRYIKKCQVKTTFFFMGSTDVSQAEQLKALYLKQEFSKFVFASQGMKPADLQAEFLKFVDQVNPRDLSGPTWRPGQSRLT